MAKRKNGKYDIKIESVIFVPAPGTTCFDEFKEVIEMSKQSFHQHTGDVSSTTRSDDSAEIHPNTASDLHNYVTILASMYRCNEFHSFDHACHVSMSVTKLLDRLVSSDLTDHDLKRVTGGKGSHHHLDFSSYGINTDPLAQFALVFSALIHDVDHRGCSNMQLCKEDKNMASRYRSKSVAEQNSLDLAWDLLMSPQFSGLRHDLFGTQEELRRFRQFIVNAVLATDIFDKELNDLRKARWEKAFSTTADHVASSQNDDTKATIVIEHIMQASDVSHTMQHWHIYQKWNKRLFKEMYVTFQDGRMAVDPSTFWYHGELAFFDNYVIPLAEKLKECKVFGVSADEYLNYAGKWIISCETHIIG